MRKNLILTAAAVLLLAGCSHYRGPVWVMKIDSAPTGARIYSSQGGADQPRAYIGTAPCYGEVSAKAGGQYWGRLTIWADPPTNCPTLYPQNISFSGYLAPVKLPPALFFDLSKAPKS